MEGKIKVSNPLDLSGAHNVRDLGTYVNAEGKKLREHQFLRGDSLDSLTNEDRKRLMNYGVKAVIDLRSSQEKEQAPCVWEGSGEVDYYSIPLLDEMNSSAFQSKFPGSMSELYIKLLENNKAEFAQALRIMSGYKEDCVIFNCTAGKDRTGVTAMLLLILAGVDHEVIIADYSASEANMKETFQRQKEQMLQRGIEVPECAFQSRPEQMAETLKALDSKYGTADAYINTLGLKSEEISCLKQKLLL